MEPFVAMIDVLGSSDSPVLLRGEPGVGKKRVARRIHEAGQRRLGRFLAMDCGLISDDPAGEGIDGEYRAPFALAEGGGTLYLKNVGALTPSDQGCLVEILRKQAARRGAGRAEPLSGCRVIAGSDVDLEPEVERGRFRDDLYFHLQGVTFHIPPLRERMPYFPGIVLTLIHEIAKEWRKEVKTVSVDAVRLLQDYHWPGNIRELKTVLQKGVARVSGDVLRPEHLVLPWIAVEAERRPSLWETVATLLQERAKAFPRSRKLIPEGSGIYQEMIREVERSMIDSAIRLADGNKQRAARILGITRTTIRKKIAEYEL
jgi:two-component system nitrogen regulation response regulator GlnG